ncbi:FAD-dependent oxidoreductase [Burkholderia pseudomallei]|uniref:FAD-dependent oxidoreductase n=1 Tax=Burkholderia pseudomallei TaxID=28450 RepID=UPI001AAF068A|nr:FAD-dependent oxidoreductase [Burkholderia pseudomallei]MBO2986441.1 FAD-dependent monooxygenase [Burkholderia pseudomallei]MBO7918712.1 FAD-dependent monooxygenase [Burkholderia pseudomallei]
MFIAKRAIVIGAGIGGLSAARALADSFETVIIIERDKVPDNAQLRPGVPQGRQPHGILQGGLTALDRLFGDFTKSLREAGAKEIDWGHFLWEPPGRTALPRRNFGIKFSMCTRPLIERTILNRLKALPNIVLLDERRATELALSPDGNSVVAVHCRNRRGTMERHEADLVVDTSGRGELTLDTLRTTGREVPTESKIEVDYYASSIVIEIPQDADLFEAAMRTCPDAPGSSLTGLLIAREQYIWAYLGGRGKDAPPDNWPKFLEFTRRLSSNTIYRAIKDAVPQSEVSRFAIPEYRRRHFEKLSDFPTGLIALGDAVCRFNPIYGQGMSTACMEAEILKALLSDYCSLGPSLVGLPQRLFAAFQPLLDSVWSLSATPDLIYPAVRGERPQHFDETVRYFDAIQQASLRDAEIHELFYQVLGLVKPIDILFDANVVGRVGSVVASNTADLVTKFP